MSKRIMISGLGRVGRYLLKGIFGSSSSAEVVGLIDANAAKSGFLADLAYLIKYDTLHGRYAKYVSYDEDSSTITIEGKTIGVYSDNSAIGSLNADIVVDCTGSATEETMIDYLNNGAGFAISANYISNLPTVDCEVNGSATIMPAPAAYAMDSGAGPAAKILKVMNDSLGVTEAFIDVIRSSANGQNVYDGYDYSAWREGRSVFQNILPTADSSGKYVGRIIPELNGKIMSQAHRVPSICGDMVKVTASVSSEVSADELNALLKNAGLAYNDEGITSVDAIEYPCLIDTTQTASSAATKKILCVSAFYSVEAYLYRNIYDMIEYINSLD